MNDEPQGDGHHADDKLLCYCKNVRYGEVRACIADGARNLDDVMKRTSAGTGCRSCQFDIEELFVEARAKRAAEGGGFWRRLFRR